MTSPAKTCCRVLVFVIAIVIFGYVCHIGISILETFQNIESQAADFGSIEFNDATKSALEIKLDQSQSYLTFITVLAGVAWGLILVSKDTPTISLDDIPEGLIFIFANVTIAVNIVCHVLYTETMAALVATGGISAGIQPANEPNQQSAVLRVITVPNLFDGRFDEFASAQQWTLVCALLLVALVVFSTHKLKEHGKCTG